jgi:hypothetical protein
VPFGELCGFRILNFWIDRKANRRQLLGRHRSGSGFSSCHLLDSIRMK